MSPEVLREAARLMRERASAASGSPWVAFRANDRLPHGDPWFGVTRDLAVDYDPDVVSSQRLTAADAEHIASWHPAVALAVADWLEATAREFDSLDNPDLSDHPLDGRRTAALAVAHSYLGDSA